MIDTQGDPRLHLLVERMETRSQILRAWRLAGGVSSEATALEVRRTDGSIRRMVVRRHGAVDLAQNPQVAVDEFRLLGILRSRGMRVPEPYYVDDTCQVFPTPFVVIEYVEGETDFSPSDLSYYSQRAAEELARIHQLAEPDGLNFLSNLGCGFGERPLMIDDSLSEGPIRDALEAVWPLPRINEPVLLHGDYWPGNLLWRDGQLVAVIDWEDARVGDPLADLGNSRLEFLFFFGAEAMEIFTRCYLSATEVDTAHLPYWDLRAALRPCSILSTWGLEPTIEQQIRERHREFVDQALQRLQDFQASVMK